MPEYFNEESDWDQEQQEEENTHQMQDHFDREQAYRHFTAEAVAEIITKDSVGAFFDLLPDSAVEAIVDYVYELGEECATGEWGLQASGVGHGDLSGKR